MGCWVWVQVGLQCAAVCGGGQVAVCAEAGGPSQTHRYDPVTTSSQRLLLQLQLKARTSHVQLISLCARWSRLLETFAHPASILELTRYHELESSPVHPHLTSACVLIWPGITNFDLARTKELVEAGVDVACTQVQLSMLDQRPKTSGLLDYAQR